MRRTSILLVALTLAAATFVPTAAAHIPGGNGPSVNYWITCGTTPSTWPSCAVTDAVAWCLAECLNWAFLAVEIVVHCFDHLRIGLELCVDMPA